MAKYDFNTSTYVKLWDSIEGRQLIEYILNSPDMLRQNNTIWKRFFDVDNYTFPIAPDGTASFTMKVREIQPQGMAHMRAPMGDTVTKGESAIEKFSGTIPDFISTGTVEKAMERDYKEKLYAQLGGNDMRLLVGYAANVVQMQQDELNATLSNLAMQVMSKGNCVYSYGQGITNAPLLKMPIEDNRFLTAGTKVWNAGDCQLLTQMRAIEKHAKEDVLGEDVALEWKLDYDTYWNVFMQNAEVQNYVKDRIYLEKGVKIDYPLLQAGADYTRYLSGIEGVGNIVVVAEHQFNNGAKVHGWASGKAVLSPVGKQGKVLRKEIMDRVILDKYANPAISHAWGTSADGLMLLQNSTLPNGQLKEWQTMMMMSAIPVLDEWPYHFIVDTTTADS